MIRPTESTTSSTRVRSPLQPRIRTPRPVTTVDGADGELIMNGVQVRSIDLTGVDSDFAELAGSRLAEVRLSASQWRHAAFADSELIGCDLANAEFVESGWQRIAIGHSKLVGIRAAGCSWKNVRLSDSMINLANLRFLEAQRVQFEGCNLTGVDLGSAQLTDVRFVDCDLSEADFSNARLARVRFERCRLARIGGVAGLAGASVGPDDLLQLADSLAAALGLRVETEEDGDDSAPEPRTASTLTVEE
ncbi:pentapeptide repeat-containing protein [Microlunatus soli]|uniref:Pentapeptide repeat-containing protein n=1 Tax=Microlunatus soli TaxID=630515 RepID=A0A1H1P775_9ACTN|nr:pentapeptide repeat-containing protein [Microlunatus soli]SDS07091.1 Pentapeptide repeat-containing protein [Microlunatus soli]